MHTFPPNRPGKVIDLAERCPAKIRDAIRRRDCVAAAEEREETRRSDDAELSALDPARRAALLRRREAERREAQERVHDALAACAAVGVAQAHADELWSEAKRLCPDHTNFEDLLPA